MNLRTLKRLDIVLGHLLIFALRPFAQLLGAFLKRDHDLSIKRQLVVLKLLGGGSLIVAMPVLLALRRKHPTVEMTLVCTRGVKSFAELMHIFDDIVVVETSSPGAVVSSGITALRRSWRADCIIDLEVHSKLSTVFCLLTCARNRVGYFMEHNPWRLGLGTHFLFLNVTSLIAASYNQLANLFEARIDIVDTVAWFRSENSAGAQAPPHRHERLVALAPFCSELGREREFSADEWVRLLNERDVTCATVLVLGEPSRAADAVELEQALSRELADCEIVDLVGKTSLSEAVGLLRQVSEILTIDSGLNHLARLSGTKVVSFWGPTAPETRLLPIPGLEEQVFYRKIFCSPCVHLIDVAPCHGDNICMKQHTGSVDIAAYEARGWSIDRDTSLL